VRIDDAAKILADIYRNAPHKEQALSIHLFGIKYADQIREMPSQTLAVMAGLGKSYGSEIRKGINLAKYVKLREM